MFEEEINTVANKANIEKSLENSLESIGAIKAWTTNVALGRASTLELPDSDIISVKVTVGLGCGDVTVNPDDTLVVVLTGTTKLETQGFNVEISDGKVSKSTVTLTVSAGTQNKACGIGDFYMLETDDRDNLVIEYGENHRSVYISGDECALTKADIDAIENLAGSGITSGWMETLPEYGGSEDMELAQDFGRALWGRITGLRAEDYSKWLLLKQGCLCGYYSLETQGRTNNNADDDLKRNVEGLDRCVLGETTIKSFTSKLPGRDHDTNLATLSYLPCAQDGDSVYLGGNWVHYSGPTTLDNLSFRDTEKLDVYQGYMKLDNTVDVSDRGAALDIHGQFWSNGHTDLDLLTMDACGGRSTNAGLLNGSAEMRTS